MSTLTPPLTQGTWSDPALRVLRERYLDPAKKYLPAATPSTDGPGETPEDMCWRVATAIAAAEAAWGKTDAQIHEIAREFYEIMVQRSFLPNSPTLMNAGKHNQLQYAACFVLPIGDSMEEIFDAVKRAALIHKSGGGTGFAFSRLRPKNSLVQSTGGKSSGPVSFLRVFNAATEAVKQGGTRRGANMAILRVDHPDILEFIRCKLDGGITNFNISVAITDSFMEALAANGEYDLVAPHTHEVTGRLPAREVFEAIVRAAWRTGDPGLVFIDRVNQSSANPVPALETIEATNPCGEMPLAANDVCNLGSINLARFAMSPETDGSGNGHASPGIDWKRLDRVIRTAVRFLDDVIDVNPYPLPEIAEQARRNRRIGLGVMGWADLLIQLGIPYNSQTALDLAGQLMQCITTTGRTESARLAEERGPFPHWSRSIYRDGGTLRNATVTTIAPTGTISIIAGCASGIEPLFALAFRHSVEDRHLTFVNPHFEAIAKARGFYSPALMEQVVTQGTVQHLPEVPEDVRRVFVTAHDIPPEWHVRMQAAFQRHTDNGVSKTINLPTTATQADIADAYRLAWDLGCLGITVFRDGCKDAQVLHVGATAPATAETPPTATVTPRPRRVVGETYRCETPLGTAFVTINHNGDTEPFEVFVSVGKAGTDTAAVSEAIGRLLSLGLRFPSPMTPRDRMTEMVGQLTGIGGARPLGFGRERIRSLPDGIGQVLAEYLGLAQPETDSAVQLTLPQPAPRKLGDLCPDCGQATFVYEEGCMKCYSCGRSEC